MTHILLPWLRSDLDDCRVVIAIYTAACYDYIRPHNGNLWFLLRQTILCDCDNVMLSEQEISPKKAKLY